MTHLNYDYLVGVDAATYQPKPELATSWSSSPDGLTWTFTIRQGVKWQDGQPFTASDVAFTFNYIIKNNLTNFTMFTGGIKDVTAPNPTTAVFHLSKPWALMLRMYIPILPEHIWSKIPAAKAQSTFQNAHPVGTGPFQVTSFTPGQTVVMMANKNYWRGAPKVNEVVFESYVNANTMADDLKSGAISVAWGLPEAEFTQLQHAPGITAINGLAKGFEEMGMDTYTPPPGGKSAGNPVLRDWKFRQALNYAVNKTAILDTAYSGYGTVATSVIQPGYFPASNDYHWQPSPSQTYTFDIAKAGQMLTAAGYPLKNGVRLNKQGKPITLSLIARSESPESQRAGKLLASWFTQLGLKINYEVLDEAALLAKQYNFVGKTYDPEYDLFLWDWVGSGSDPNYILSVFTTAADRQPERLPVLEPDLRQALRGAADHNGSDPAQGDHLAHAAAALPAVAVHRARLSPQPRGLLRQVDRLCPLAGQRRQRDLQRRQHRQLPVRASRRRGCQRSQLELEQHRAHRHHRGDRRGGDRRRHRDLRAASVPASRAVSKGRRQA